MGFSPGHVAAISGSDGVVIYKGRITAFVLFSCLVAATGGLIFGYDNGVTGGVTSMDPFLKEFFPGIYKQMEDQQTSAYTSNYCKFDSQILTLFTSSLFLAGLIASSFASAVTRRSGRRVSILIGGASFLSGALIGASAVHVSMLIIGRLLLGIGVGFTNQSVPLYLSEMAPARYRGAFSTGFQFCVCIGVIFANILNYVVNEIKISWGWRVSLAMAAVPAAVLAIGGLFLPETPNNLIENGASRDKVEKLLQKIRGIDDVEEELNDLIGARDSAGGIVNQSPFKSILCRRYRPQLVMAIAIPFFQQVTGINIVTFYAPILFRTIGAGVSASLMSALIISAIGTTMTVLSMVIVDKFGRRALFIAGGIQMIICQILIGAILSLELGDHGELGKQHSVIVLILMSFYVAGFGLSWGPLGWLVTSEIFPMEIRSAGQSVSIATNFLVIFVIAQAFLAMLCRLKAGVFFFFAAWVAVMTVFVYGWLPETKDVPIEKMGTIWRKHWYWSRFVHRPEEETAGETDDPTFGLLTAVI